MDASLEADPATGRTRTFRLNRITSQVFHDARAKASVKDGALHQAA